MPNIREAAGVMMELFSGHSRLDYSQQLEDPRLSLERLFKTTLKQKITETNATCFYVWDDKKDAEYLFKISPLENVDMTKTTPKRWINTDPSFMVEVTSTDLSLVSHSFSPGFHKDKKPHTVKMKVHLNDKCAEEEGTRTVYLVVDNKQGRQAGRTIKTVERLLPYLHSSVPLEKPIHLIIETETTLPEPVSCLINLLLAPGRHLSIRSLEKATVSGSYAQMVLKLGEEEVLKQTAEVLQHVKILRPVLYDCLVKESVTRLLEEKQGDNLLDDFRLKVLRQVLSPEEMVNYFGLENLPAEILHEREKSLKRSLLERERKKLYSLGFYGYGILSILGSLALKFPIAETIIENDASRQVIGVKSFAIGFLMLALGKFSRDQHSNTISALIREIEKLKAARSSRNQSNR